MPFVFEVVQRCGGDGSKLLGPNEEYLPRVLGDMEVKVGMLLEEILGLKRCFKGKEVMDLGQVLDFNVLGQLSDQREMGLREGSSHVL